MQKIKNIIFDLGGVILNIDLKKTELAFAELGVGNFKEYYTLQHSSPLFHNLELGLITPENFYEEFRKLAKIDLTNEQIKFYVEKYKPYDKAGAYAIQEWIGVVGIKSINGDFYNVMGLPVSRVVKELKKFENNSI